MAALVKTGRQLDNAQAAGCGRQNVEQNLETLRGNLRRQRLEGVAPDHEMTTHRIGEIDAEQTPHQHVGEMTGAGALFGKSGGGAAAEIAARHDEVASAATQPIAHGGKQFLVVLQVGIHDRDIARLARQHAFETGAGEAAPADPADAADPAVGFADGARRRRRAVGRIVVDEQHFPFAIGEHALKPLDQDRNIGALIERRHDDAELRRPHAVPEAAGRGGAIVGMTLSMAGTR